MDIDDLLSALEEYDKAGKDVSECIRSNEYYDYCSRQIELCARKKAELTLALNMYIDARVRHVLSGTE